MLILKKWELFQTTLQTQIVRGLKKAQQILNIFILFINSTDPDTTHTDLVTTSAPRQQMSQGAFQATGGALDLAVTGQGFFTVVQGGNIEDPYFTRV